MRSTKIYKFYLTLSKKYKEPQEFWKEWCKRKKTWQDKERIVLGAILTQRTSWKNVELALNNLKKARILSVKGVYRAGKRDIKLLERLIRPSGFYRQKAKRLFQLCKFIVKSYDSLEKFFDQDLKICREELLSLYGVGPETADSILLYAGDKPIFVIDEYTRRFVQKYHLAKEFFYDCLQQLFQQSLPKNVSLYQDFHAMIVLEGKNGE